MNLIFKRGVVAGKEIINLFLLMSLLTLASLLYTRWFSFQSDSCELLCTSTVSTSYKLNNVVLACAGRYIDISAYHDTFRVCHVIPDVLVDSGHSESK